MAKLGHPRRSRRLWWVAGAIAVVSIAASFGAPKVGCAGSAEDESAESFESVSSLLETLDHTPSVSDGASLGRLYPINPSAFCTTAGAVTPVGLEALKVDTAGMRGVVARDASRSVELAFVFRGKSKEAAPLANGEMRQQIGVKLRAKDTCNIVYVMWQVAPVTRVAVAVKSNPGLATHAQCGDRGYINLKPTVEVGVPQIRLDEPHSLRADLDGDTLLVHADGINVWTGKLPAQAFAFDGPVGMRSDNGEFDFQLRVPGGGDREARCKNPGTEQAH